MSDLMIPAWVEPMMRALRPELRKKLSLRDIDDIRKSVEAQIATERERVAQLQKCVDYDARKFDAALIAERERADRAERELLDTTWQDHADHWQKRAEKAEAELAALRADAERYRWLRNSAKEELLYPARAVGDMPDLRTKWALPVFICSGPVGGFRSFDETIDAQIDAAREGRG